MLLVEFFDSLAVLDQMEISGADIILGVPTMIGALLYEQEARVRNLSALKLVSCGCSIVSPDLVRRVHSLMRARFSIFYGQTDYCAVITQNHLSDKIDDICTTVGQPVARTEVSISSLDDNVSLAIGNVGEICARGPCSILEFNDDPKATSETLDSDDCLHTVDLGRMDSRGHVSITDRVKDMIIRGGENHFPAEIENCLLEYLGVAEVAVVDVPEEKWGEFIGASIHSKSPLRKLDLHSHYRANISPQKTPSVWIQVEHFPLTGLEKIQRFKLKEYYQAGLLREIR